MKKKTVLFISLLALTAVVISACQPLAPVDSVAVVDDVAAEYPENPAANPTSVGYGNGPGTGNEECDGECPSGGGHGQHGGGQHGDGMASQVPAYAIGEISEAEADGLAFMREEEKLARDVYLTLYDQWGLRPFSNIAASEQTHTDAVKSLLEMYEIADPVTDDTIGVFANEDLQALNDQLVETGSASLEDALKVGAAIEEIDILDLIEYLEGTEEANIEWVYENLLAGSENHLRAFVSQLESLTGETYVPQYMSQEAYDAIISAENARGGGHGGNGGHGSGRN
jgi:hypothetical protein